MNILLLLLFNRSNLISLFSSSFHSLAYPISPLLIFQGKVKVAAVFNQSLHLIFRSMTSSEYHRLCHTFHLPITLPACCLWEFAFQSLQDCKGLVDLAIVL